jgi:hypothetical protein
LSLLLVLLFLLLLQRLSVLLRQLLSLLLALLLLLLLLSTLLGQLLSLLLALLLFQLLSSCLVPLLLCELRVVALLLLLNPLSFGRLLSSQLLLLLQMLTLKSGICAARRRWAGDLRQLLRVDRNCRRSRTRPGRARRPYGLTIRTRRRGNPGSSGRMYHGRHGGRSKFDRRGDRRSTGRYAADCADAQRSSAILLDGFLAPLERRWRRGRRHPGNNRSRLYDRRRSRCGQSTAAED